MIGQHFLYPTLFVLALMVGCDDKDNTDTAERDTSIVSEDIYGIETHISPMSSDYQYTNPVLYVDCPDPSVCLGHDGRYYLYATASNIYVYSSADLVNWEKEENVFNSTDRPRPADSNNLWAPDMNYVDGHYLFYYTVNTGSSSTRYINVMTSDSPVPPFVDQGTVIDPSLGVVNSIDQCFWEEEDGSRWMFWGCFSNSIYVIELSADGLTVKEGAEKQKVGGTLIEGTMIYKRDGYYYMIGSAGSYHGGDGYNGVGATYHLVVARSENLLGPYVDKEGNLATDNGFSELLNGSDEVSGPGHCSEVLEMADGSTWLVYHGWPADDLYYGRVDYLSQIFWDNTGWPYFVLNKPSVTWDKPPVTPYTFTYSNVDYMDFLGDNVGGKFLYDTGYVPNENTRIELKFRSYPKTMYGVNTTGYLRRIFQTDTSDGPGFSLYLSSDGSKFGYSAYGEDDSEIADHEFATDYEVTATLNSLTINGATHSVTGGSTAGKWERITLFSGTKDYPFRGRIYYFKIYEGNELIHDFEPVLRNEDGMVMFHDTVSGGHYLPYDTAGFAYGNIVN